MTEFVGRGSLVHGSGLGARTAVPRRASSGLAAAVARHVAAHTVVEGLAVAPRQRDDHRADLSAMAGGARNPGGADRHPAGSGGRPSRRPVESRSAPPGADSAAPLRGQHRRAGDGGGHSDRIHRRQHGLAHHRVRVSRPACRKLAPGTPVGVAHLYRRDLVCRHVRLHGTGATAVSPCPGDGPRQLSDPRRADLRRAELRAHRHRISLRLSDHASRVCPAGRGGHGGRALPRIRVRAGVPPRRAAARQARHRRRRRPGRHGDTRRVRRLAFLRRRYPDHRHLSRLVRPGQRGCCPQPGGGTVAGGRGNPGPGALAAQPRPLSRAERPAATDSPCQAARTRRGSDRRVVRHSGGARVHAAGSSTRLVGAGRKRTRRPPGPGALPGEQRRPCRHRFSGHRHAGDPGSLRRPHSHRSPGERHRPPGHIRLRQYPRRCSRWASPPPTVGSITASLVRHAGCSGCLPV